MSDLLRSYIRSLLLEAPIDVWKKKNSGLLQDQIAIAEAEKYFQDLSGSGRLVGRLHPSVKDLTRMSMDQIALLHRVTMLSVEKNLKAYTSVWLTGQLSGPNPPALEQIEEDYIPELQRFQLAVKSPDVDVKDIEKLPDIESLSLYLSEKSPKEEEGEVVSTSSLGKIGPSIDGWSVYMPHTTAASCALGKTGGKRDTTWCTTREDSSNLYTRYVLGSEDKSIILFYVIKDGNRASKSNPYAKMSVGFINGNPVFSAGHGGVTVDALNNNLSRQEFYGALGRATADEFLSRMRAKIAEMGGKHPLKVEEEKKKKYYAGMAKDHKALEKKISQLTGQDSRDDFIKEVLDNEPTPESYKVIIDSNPSAEIISLVSIYAPIPDVIDYLLSSGLPLTPRDLESIINNQYVDLSAGTLEKVLDRKYKVSAGKGMERLLKTLSKEKLNKPEMYFFTRLASKSVTPPDVLVAIFNNRELRSDPDAAAALCYNPSTPLDVIKKFLEMGADSYKSKLLKTRVIRSIAENSVALGNQEIARLAYEQASKDEIKSNIRHIATNLDPSSNSSIIESIFASTMDQDEEDFEYTFAYEDQIAGLMGLAQNEKILDNKKLLKRLISANIPRVNTLLVQNPGLPSEIKKQILLDPSSKTKSLSLKDVEEDELKNILAHKIVRQSSEDFKNAGPIKDTYGVQYEHRDDLRSVLKSDYITIIKPGDFKVDDLKFASSEIAENSSTPMWLLEEISDKMSQEDTGRSLSYVTTITVDFLERLFENPNVTEKIVRKFENHQSKKAAKMAKEKLQQMRGDVNEAHIIRSLVRQFIRESARSCL